MEVAILKDKCMFTFKNSGISIVCECEWYGHLVYCNTSSIKWLGVEDLDLTRDEIRKMLRRIEKETKHTEAEVKFITDKKLNPIHNKISIQ